MLCLDTPYRKECEATVLSVTGKFVELDTNLFYPQGGGQPGDTGSLIVSSVVSSVPITFRVVNTTKKEGKVLHELDRIPTNDELKAGDHLHCLVDWDRRYKLMRMHTTAHVLCAIMHRKFNALVSGGQIDTETSRLDFTFEGVDAAKAFEVAVHEANEKIRHGAQVKWYSLPREDALKIPGVVKLATALPPTLSHLRIVEIEGIDIQADGGTHVKQLSEIGAVTFVRMESKGAKNKRMYFSV